MQRCHEAVPSFTVRLVVYAPTRVQWLDSFAIPHRMAYLPIIVDFVVVMFFWKKIFEIIL